MYDLVRLRSQIPILRSMIPMNNCSHSPQTDVTRRAAEEYLESWNTRGMDWDAWMMVVEGARAAFARLINASVEEIAVTSSVSEATSSIASALRFEGGRRRIVVTEAEFPTVGHVWLAQRARGAEIAWVPVHDGVIAPEAYDSVLDDRTLLLSACHAYYQNGFKQDLAMLVAKARAVGALLYVDAYQTLGTHPIDVTALGVDMLACGSLKYLMGVPGIAFLYVRRELAERMEPTLTGWFGRADPFAFRANALTWAGGARRFDTGTPPIVNAYIARAGMEMIESVGVPAIHEWTDTLSRRLVAGGIERGLQPHGSVDVSQKTPLTAFVCPRDAHAVERSLRERKIIAAARGSVLRLAPHFYSSIEDVDAALDALRDEIAPAGAAR